MSFLFTRRFYVAFGGVGFAMDYVAHYLTAVSQSIAGPEVATLKLVAGWNDVFLASGQFGAFSLGVAAHSMFLVAFVLLAIRGK